MSEFAILTPVGMALSGKLEGVYNVKDFGAVGAGLTNDWAGMQAALDSAGASTYKGIVYVPPGRYLTHTTLIVPAGVRLVGAGQSVSIIQPLGAFPANTPVVQLGAIGTPAFGTWLEDLYIFANSMADYGVYSESLNTHSGLYRVAIGDCHKKALYITGANSDNYTIRHVGVSLSTTATGASIGAHLESVVSARINIDDLHGVANGRGTATIVVQFDGVHGSARNLHPHGKIVVGGVTACVALTIDGVFGDDAIATLVQLGNVQNDNVQLLSIWRGPATVTIQDDFTGLSYTDAQIGFYSTGTINDGAVPNYPIVQPLTSTPAALAAGNNNNYALATSRIGVLRLVGDAGGTSVITGITGGKHGRELWIYNVGAFNIAIAHNSANSVAANRIDIPISATVNLVGLHDVAHLKYDGVAGTETPAWRLVSTYA